MPDLLVATSNAGKAREFQQLLGGEWNIATLQDLPEIGEIVEDGDTFEANARIKALAVSNAGFEWVIADDSGLEVDALNGAPGVISARYAGEGKDMAANIKKLLGELAGRPPAERGAQFRCVLVLARLGQIEAVFEGICRGSILEAPRGDRGFGYDPIFEPDGYFESFGELDPVLKNQISHRGKASAQLRAHLLGGA
jgi:XTP/dITP diphosphohydrolase